MVTGMETVQEEECGWRERVGGQRRIAVRQKKDYGTYLAM